MYTMVHTEYSEHLSQVHRECDTGV